MKPNITHSAETTYLMEPQRSDGCIDYLEALNEQLAAQTTSENNLLVGISAIIAGEQESLFVKRGKTKEDKDIPESTKKFRERFFKRLGLDAPPPLDSLIVLSPAASGKNLKTELLEFFSMEELTPSTEKQRQLGEDYVGRRCGKMTKEGYDAKIKEFETEIEDWHYQRIISDMWDETRKRPWTAKEFPYIAKWLAMTDEVAKKLINLSQQRTGYYHPYLQGNENYFSLYDVLLPYVQSFRMVARYFESLGNFEFARKRFDQAMECAFSSVRMGRTMRGGSGCCVEDLVGIAVIGVGYYRLTTYLANLSKEKDATWILQKRKEYDAIEATIPLLLPPKWCRLERYAALEAIQSIAVDPKILHDKFKIDGNTEDTANKFDKLFNTGTEYDWDEILKKVNSFYDEYDVTLQHQSWHSRLRAAALLQERVIEGVKHCVDSHATPEDKAVDFIFGTFSPSIEAPMNALARIECGCQITSVAFALAAYRADNGGESPDSLEQLIPKYLETIPDSPFTDKPLRYIKRQQDVLIVMDDGNKFDGNEEEIEKKIAEAESGGWVYPPDSHYQNHVFVVTKM